MANSTSSTPPSAPAPQPAPRHRLPGPLRWLLWGLLGLVGLIILVAVGLYFALQVPSVQDWAAQKAAGYLQGKIGTEVRINKFRTDWRHGVALEGVYLEDQKGDTLLAVGKLAVGVDLWALTKSQINVSNVELLDGTVHIARTLPDSTYNFDYILAAFATGDTTTTTAADSTGGFKYDIGDAHLARVYLTYNDEVDGMNVRGRVGDLAVRMKEVDVDHSIYRVETASLKNTGLSVVQTKVPPDTPAEPLTLTFGLDRASLDNVAFNYQNDPSKQYIKTRIGQALVTADNIDLIRQRIGLNSLVLRNSEISYAQNSSVPVEQRVVNPAETVQKVDSAVAQTTGAPTSWRVALKNSDISGVRFAFDNLDEAKQRTRLPAMDYNHLLFDSLALRTRNLVYTENRTTGRIDLLRGREQSGFRVDKAQADVVYDSVQIRLDNLDLVTPHTRIRRTLAIGFDSLGALADTRTLGRTRIEANLQNTRLGFRDILYLAPDLITEKPFTSGPNQSVLLSGQVNGRLDNLALNNVEIVGLRGTVVKASGRIQGLPNTDRRLYTDLNIRQLTTTKRDLLDILPAGTIPQDVIELPERATLSGTVKGRPTANDLAINLNANTSFGGATIAATLRPGPAGKEPIDARFNLRGFNLGRLLKQPDIGAVTGSGTYKGVGFDPETMRGQLTANLQQARYGNYTYQNINANVGITGQRYDITARSAGDQNAAFNIKGFVDLSNPNAPQYSFGGSVQSLNLTALGFYSGGNLSLKGDLDANLRGADLNSLNGTVKGTGVVINLNGQAIPLDSLNARILQETGRVEVDFASSILQATLRGNTRLGDIGTELQQHIDRYFDLPGVQYRASGVARQFTFEVNVPRTGARLLPRFVTGLTRISPFRLTGAYDSRAANLTVRTDVARMRYSGTTFDSLKLRVGSDPQKLDYSLGLDQVYQDTTLKIPNPSLTGSIANNQIGTRLRIAESDSVQRLSLGGTLQVLNNAQTYQFSFAPDIVLDNKQWTAAPGGVVRYTLSSGNIDAQNVRISRSQGAADRFLALQTLPGARNPLQVQLGNLDLNGLGRAAGLQDSLVGGTLNGQAVAYNLGRTGQAFTADLTLGGFAYNKYVLGDLRAQVQNTTADRYDLNAQLTKDDGTDVRLTGYYATSGAIDVVANIAQFNLKAIEPFSAGQIRESTGALTGRFTVTGTTAAPQLRGAARFRDGGFTLSQLGAPFRLSDQELTLTDRGLHFDQFAIIDSLGSRAIVDGYIVPARQLAQVGQYRLQLTATTDHFLAVQSTRRDNPLYYGKLFVDSETQVRGNLQRPNVRTRATVAEGSNLTIVVPTDEAVAVEREGIVVFVDKDAPKPNTDSLLALTADDIDSAAVATGYDVRANVTVTDKTPFKIVIDEAAGDNLQVRAAGTLNAVLDERGAQTLTGRLDVTSGQYELSLYDLAERKFDIAPGSYLVWSGDPYNAQLNVSAIYRVRAVAADLIANQLDAGSELSNLARNRLPFEVYLNVTDQLLKPTIGFDIRVPEGTTSPVAEPVRAKLEQLRQPSNVNELNKQVFALLALNRFIAENPFQSTAGPGSFVGNQLRGSASQVLTDQLNNLTGEYLAGLGLELGVDSYTAVTGTGAQQNRTDLNVAVRRQLLNDRLSVRLGTDVPLAGGSGGGSQATQGAGSASQFAGDVSIEYNLLPDGRLRLRAFRNNAYEDIDGQFIRTGASIIFQRDYNNLQELFQKVAPEVKESVKADRKARKAEKAAAQDTLKNNALN
ncbi:translocation/assembly module TamB domain-containing protein [Hymenobacter sp. 15J16-1T3B]|uniref:translocation/assembly module TamB domain-containing protein n=1 Tax=Hymenobacter sp. 15J16-1T3B TaxID=2886941 RepID=UPI001D1022E6|nr:translocation/assembly module TamB domain-containing protein [Hymenobacter sp. 15J16-1T3B]MCC3156253.1 translocation/assembly module TamB domain-containing protein [Hymenobacter sp. 15J16-1T3B]